MFSLLIIFCFLASFTTSAFAIEGVPNDKRPSKQEIAKMANELEYIFTSIIVKDEFTGKYNINESELNNSLYTKEEKAGMIAFSEYLNDGYGYDSGVSVFASNTFKKCMSKAIGIYGSALDQFIRYVDKKDWVGAAGVLAFFGISVHPATVFIFAMNCGASRVS